MSRSFLIALLSVLLPVGVPVHGHNALAAPRAFVATLRAMPQAGGGATRDERRKVAARPVRGVLLIPAKQPVALAPTPPQAAPPSRAPRRPHGLRAPPALG